MINKKAAGVLATGAMTLLSTMTAFSMIKTIEINADLDNVPTHEAGECFYPEYEVDEEDENGLTVTFSEPITASTDNPTVPATVKVYIASDEENLDDDLRITGTGIRSTYVDMVSVDNSEASARLQVYPFYILTAPNLKLDTAAGTLYWDPVPYAAKYEQSAVNVIMLENQNTVDRWTLQLLIEKILLEEGVLESLGGI